MKLFAWTLGALLLCSFPGAAPEAMAQGGRIKRDFDLIPQPPDTWGALTESFLARGDHSYASAKAFPLAKDEPILLLREWGPWMQVRNRKGRKGWVAKRLIKFITPPDADPRYLDLKKHASSKPAPAAAAAPSLNACDRHAQAICLCHGPASAQCLKARNDANSEMMRDRSAALEVCGARMENFSCNANQNLKPSQGLAACHDTLDKKFYDLKFKTGTCSKFGNRIEVTALKGTSPRVAPGETFIARGKYSMTSFKNALLEFGPNGGSSRPCRQELQKGDGTFEVAALIVFTEEGELNDLLLAYITPDMESTAGTPLACPITVVNE